MTKYKTTTGRILTEADLDAIAEEVETTDYDIATLRKRRRGRPLMGSAPAGVVPVRIDPELRAAVAACAETGGRTTSEIIREALRRFLDVERVEQTQHAVKSFEEIRTRSVPMAHPDDLLQSDDARIAVAGLYELERLLAQNTLDPVAIRDLLEEPSGLYQRFYRLWSDMQGMAQSSGCEDRWLAGQAEAQLRHGTAWLGKILDHAIAKAGSAPALPPGDEAKSVLMENFDRWSGQNGLSIRIDNAARRFLDS